MQPPGHDFYATTAQVIPLLLITAALEGKRLSNGSGEEPLTVGILFFAVGAEIASLAGLTGRGSNFTAAATVFGLAILATALLTTIALPLLPAKGSPWHRRITGFGFGLALVMAPLVAAVVYVLQLSG